MKKTFILTAFLLCFINVYSQNKTTISGTIYSVDSLPVAFVNVGIQGTSIGAISNEKGVYSFTTSLSGPQTLIVSHIGLETQRKNIDLVAGKNISIDFILIESSKTINEVQISEVRNSYASNEPSSGLRINQPLINIPQNIQSIDRSILEDQQSLDMLEGVSRNVSGVQMIEHWGNFARMNMRGFKIPAFRNGMNVDLPWGPLTEDLSIVDKIEFVKGPAGFMLSSGEPGGFYNVVTKKAQLGKSQNAIGFTYGSFNTFRTYLNAGGAINKKLAFQINAMASTKKSHRDFEFNDRFTLAPSLYYQLSKNTSVSLEYIHQHSTMSVVGAAYMFSANGYADVDRNMSLGEPNIDPTKINEDNVFAYLNHRLNSSWNLKAQIGYLKYKQIGSSLWVSNVDSLGNVYRTLGVWDALSTAKLGQVFITGVENTGPIEHQLLAGIDLGNKEYFADWFQSGALGGSVPFNIYNPVHGVSSDSIPEFNREKSIRQRASGTYFANQSQVYSSIYVQDELSILDNKLRLTLAARYTAYSSESYGTPTKDEVFTPRIGLSYSLLRNLSVYGLMDQSFLPQGGTDFYGNAFLPVEANLKELGVKSQLFRNRLNATVSYYHITKDNILTSDPAHQYYSIQVGQVVSEGLELDVQGQITKELSLVFNYANTNVKVTKDSDESLVGQRLAGHSKHMHNMWLNYRFSSSFLRGFGLSLGYQHQVDRSSWTWSSSKQESLPDYFRLDGAISWKGKNTSISFNINNLLNTYLYSGSTYATYYYWQSEPGRNCRLQINYRF